MYMYFPFQQRKKQQQNIIILRWKRQENTAYSDYWLSLGGQKINVGLRQVKEIQKLWFSVACNRKENEIFNDKFHSLQDQIHFSCFPSAANLYRWLKTVSARSAENSSDGAGSKLAKKNLVAEIFFSARFSRPLKRHPFSMGSFILQFVKIC